MQWDIYKNRATLKKIIVSTWRMREWTLGVNIQAQRKVARSSLLIHVYGSIFIGQNTINNNTTFVM